ncbi:MAG: sulfatase-like hydrolase/transferase [Kofleriaceae bacterium]|nr:sulfatase-like hydrolase/transferase [Kofleriaceae bacterium]
MSSAERSQPIARSPSADHSGPFPRRSSVSGERSATYVLPRHGDTPIAWILIAHIVGAIAIGCLDCVRLGSLQLGLAVVPIFAATGLVAGLVIAGTERAVSGRSWWLSALALAVPALVVYIPVSRSLFLGAYAQTLPLASSAPYLLPVVLVVGTAIAIAIGRRVLRDADLTTRGIGVLAVAGLLGTLVWTEKHVLKTGYPTAHVGATIAVIVLAGIALRITRRGNLPAIVAAVVAAIVIASASVAAVVGLRSANDRRLLATLGDQSKDLVGVWRSLVDFDRDGAAVILGGGDCDDFDGKRHPGAVDEPGDGIDQDCDGVDAVRITQAQKAPEPGSLTLEEWRKSPEVAATLARTKGMHVLLITVDALRADLLAPDAPDRADFPAITKLLDESVWFTRAISPATGTDVSLATLLTGRFDPFQAVTATLPEALRGAGMKTFAAIPAEVLRYAGETLINRGIDKLSTVHTDWDHANVGDHVSAGATTAEGLKALADTAQPSFVWLHYFDVHEHHQIKVPAKLRESVHPGASAKAHGYRALLRAIDDEVARVLAELEAKGIADRTIVIFASDHGESLGEDPRLLETHGKVTYGPLVRVPLAFRIPGVAPGQRTDLVSLVDLAPTLLELVGAQVDLPLDGEKLLPSLLGAPLSLRPRDRALAIHEEQQWSVVEWPHQLIVNPAQNLVELYDLEADPAQKSDLSTSQPELVSRLKARFAEFPQVVVDRTPQGRSLREQRARQRPPRAP